MRGTFPIDLLQPLPVLLLALSVLWTGCDDALPQSLEHASDLALGGVELGASQEAVLVLENPSAKPVWARLALSGDRAFSLTGSWSSSVPAHSQRQVTVRFAPSVRGAAEAELSIRACETCERSTVRLTGTGLAPRLVAQPSSVDFGEVAQHDRRSLRLSLTNRGDAPATVTRLSLVPDDPAFELEVPPTPIDVPAGDALEVQLVFAPPAAGPRAARLVWRSNDPDGPEGSVSLVGRGRAVPVLEPVETHHLGQRTVGLTFAADLILLRNVGDAPLTVEDVSLQPGGGFEILPLPLPVVVQPDGVLPAEVAFTPSALGEHETTLRITTDDPVTPQASATLIGEGTGPLPCELAASRSVVDFGLTAPPLDYHRVLGVVNASEDTACELEAIRLSPDASPELTLVDGGSEAPLTLEPGGRRSVTVRFEPDADAPQGQLEFATAHPLTHLPVPLLGATAPGAPRAVPTALDLTALPPGCGEVRRRLCLYTTGVPATLEAVDVVGAPGVRLEGLEAMTVLPPADRACGDVVVSMTGPGPKEAEIRLSVSGRSSDVVVPVRVATRDGTKTERFVQAGPGKTDLLFVIDNSGSMATEQLEVSSHVGALLAPAADRAFDWQAGVTVTDCSLAPCGYLWPPNEPEPSLVQSTLPDAAGLLAANLLVGDDGVSTEKGLWAAHRTLGGAGALAALALLRPDAELAVVVVTDEPDQSGHSTGFFLDWMRAAAGGANAITVSAIAGPTPDGCTGTGGAASAAPRLAELARRTGGGFESICTDDWTAALTSLGDRIFGGRGTFVLEGTPDPVSLRVAVEGRTVAAAEWDWNPAANAVVFADAARPTPGQTVEVTYTPLCP